MRPILMLEMNEIPWRLIDRYLGDERFPFLKKFFSESETYTTVTVDAGELSPWVTWPSLHRGMGNEKHGILNLGQDPASYRGRPIWEEYLTQGHSIGICGSLQSWPSKDPGPGGFFIPDTFAHDERCIPDYVNPFQRFNLNQIKKNGRVVAKGISPGKDALGLALSFPRLGIKASTILELAKQLVWERRNPTFLARRPIFQTILLWDIFGKLFNASKPPGFSTFFTNHVAGIMHRYWHHVFPEDFDGKYGLKQGIHSGTMDFAMGLVERILMGAHKFQSINPELSVVFASSMGQAAVNRDRHEGFEASVPDPSILLSSLGFRSGDYFAKIAMVPQFALEIPVDSKRIEVVSSLSLCRTRSGHALFSVQEIGASLSVTIHTPRSHDIEAGGFHSGRGDSAIFQTWGDAGIRMNVVEAGTAYHIPEGILAIRGPGISPLDKRVRIGADKIKDILLKLGELNVQDRNAGSESRPLSMGVV